jgi:hypothetical protein
MHFLREEDRCRRSAQGRREGQAVMVYRVGSFDGIDDLRLQDSTLGLAQITAGTADTTIYSFEGNASYALTPELKIAADFGYLHGNIGKLEIQNQEISGLRVNGAAI